MNRPYIDDKLVHFGFSLGLDLMSYSVGETLEPVSGMLPDAGDGTFTDLVLHPRVSTVSPTFAVGLIVDFRLNKYLNLRFTPELHLPTNRTISYRFDKDAVSDKGESLEKKLVKTDVMSMPISVPLLLKWSADRESNYRPYIVAGAGLNFVPYTDKTQYVNQDWWDGFIQVGMGCDFYFSWFKLCPEIKYQMGLRNILVPLAKTTEDMEKKNLHGGIDSSNWYYTDAISRLRSHMISIVFNFE
jgi:hypothetical protein